MYTQTHTHTDPLRLVVSSDFIKQTRGCTQVCMCVHMYVLSLGSSIDNPMLRPRLGKKAGTKIHLTAPSLPLSSSLLYKPPLPVRLAVPPPSVPSEQ